MGGSGRLEGRRGGGGVLFCCGESQRLSQKQKMPEYSTCGLVVFKLCVVFE